MKKTTKILGLVLALSVGFLMAAPQEPTVTSPTKPDFSKEASVIESYRTAVSFENDGTGTRDITAKARIQSDAGVKSYSVLVLAYSSASERLDTDYVRVRQADGTVVPTPESSIQDMTSDVTRQAPEYSDLREKHVAVKGLVPGSIIEYHIRYHLFSPLIPGQFWLNYDFTKTGIVLDEELQVSVPKDRPLKMKSTEIQPASEIQGDRRIYTWKSSNLERKELPPYPFGDLPPPAVQLSTFQTWDALGSWWAGLEKPQMAATPEIRAKATELTQGLTTEDQKLHAIYAYVASGVHYISISFGIGRYQPHAAGEVLKNAYGDCKDKHTLLASLLQAAGIKAWPVLINSARHIDPEVPSPAQFDHVITVIPQGQELQWTDTTSEVASLSFLVFTLRGKRALVVPDGQPAYLAETPQEPSEANSNDFDLEGKLSDQGALEAKVRWTAAGDVGLMVRAAFRNVGRSRWKDLVQSISYASGFGGAVSNVDASSPEDLDHPFTYSYDYARNQLGDWENHRMIAPLPPMGLPGVSEEKEKAAFPIILGLPIKADFKSKVELPKGYTPTLPDAVDLMKPYANYRSKYSFKDGVLYAERQIVLKARQVSPAQRDDYRAFQKAVSNDESRYIVLNSGGETAGELPGNPDFKKAMLEAGDEWRRQDYRGALASMQHALELDPNSAPAWTGIGQLHMFLGETDEAIKALRKAIALSPKNFAPYEALTSTLMSARRREEAEQVIRDYLKQDPQNVRARSELASSLLLDQKYLDAAVVYEEGIKLDPKNTGYFAGLGGAYAKAGESEKAVAAFEKAAQLDPSPGTWNNVGYSMADANLNLPEAEHFAKMAVEAAESEASKITLDNLGDEDLVRTTNLAYFWDTLGWVYFREGELEKARKYVGPSWMLRQESVIADHLAQIEEGLGHKQAAINNYALALATGGGSTFKVGVHTIQIGVNPGSERIRSRLALLAGSSKVDSIINRKTFELSMLRTYTFDRAGLSPGSADFFVLIGPGQRVQGVKFISGQGELKPAVKAIEAIHFNQPLPDDTPTLILRRGILSCSQVTPKCTFVFYPLDAVHSVK